MDPLRLVFIGTADLACPALEQLAGQGRFSVVAVVTQPDRPKGRDLELAPPPVKLTAQRLALPVFQPERVRQESAFRTIADWRPDLIVVAAYGQILPQAVLELPRHGCLNVHASILPQYRGASPIQWAILNGDSETGVTIMQMDAGLDTGPILTQETTPILPGDNAQTLHDRLAQIGAALLVRTLPDYVLGKIAPRPQPKEGATYARKISKEDGHLDWRQPALALWNRIRAFTPWPGTFAFLADQSKPILLKIWSASVVPAIRGQPGEIVQVQSDGIMVACGQDGLRITEVQREGKRRMTVREFLAGHPIEPGKPLT
jgi:methionyl-tRNA formyltransferase